MILSPTVTFYSKAVVCQNHTNELRSDWHPVSHPSFPSGNHIRLTLTGTNVVVRQRGPSGLLCPVFSNSVPEGAVSELSDGSEDEDGTCPVDCVKEFKTDEEFLSILEKAKKSNTLVVVDFYRTSCGSCKYIEHGFIKLCKLSADHEDTIIFLKHNVMDEYDEQTDVADRLRIKKVPLFHFYKNGVLLEQFATRDKERIVEAIAKYLTPQDAL